MSIEVTVPTPLRGLTNDQDIVQAEGKTVIELIDNLESQFPGVKERLVDEEGNLRRFINFYINGEDIRFLQDKETEIKESDEVSIVPAIAGG